jgi:hypothetical protein
LNNGQTLNDKLRDQASRVSKWLNEKLTDAEIVEQLFLLTLSRKPTNSEQAKFNSVLAEAIADDPNARREAIEDLFWAVLTSQEFLFNR